MSYHRSIQPVLGHYGAVTPTLFMVMNKKLIASTHWPKFRHARSFYYTHIPSTHRTSLHLRYAFVRIMECQLDILLWNIYIFYFFSQFVSGRYSTNPVIWLVPRAGSILPICSRRFFLQPFVRFKKKTKKCYSPAKVGPYWEKMCSLSCVPYPRPRAQFFPIRTSRLVNNIYFY